MKKCIIKREQISDIEELIQELKSSQPSGLCLRGCCLGDAGIERLVDNLPKTLESLDLVDNNITANGAKKIAVWLETSELNELLLAQALEINDIDNPDCRHQIYNIDNEYIDYGDSINKIGDEGAKAIARVLPKSKLKKISMIDPSVDLEGIHAFLTALPESQIESFIPIEEIFKNPHRCISHLDWQSIRVLKQFIAPKVWLPYYLDVRTVSYKQYIELSGLTPFAAIKEYDEKIRQCRTYVAQSMEEVLPDQIKDIEAMIQKRCTLLKNMDDDNIALREESDLRFMMWLPMLSSSWVNYIFEWIWTEAPRYCRTEKILNMMYDIARGLDGFGQLSKAIAEFKRNPHDEDKSGFCNVLRVEHREVLEIYKKAYDGFKWDDEVQFEQLLDFLEAMDGFYKPVDEDSDKTLFLRKVLDIELSEECDALARERMATLMTMMMQKDVDGLIANFNNILVWHISATDEPKNQDILGRVFIPLIDGFIEMYGQEHPGKTKQLLEMFLMHYKVNSIEGLNKVDQWLRSFEDDSLKYPGYLATAGYLECTTSWGVDQNEYRVKMKARLKASAAATKIQRFFREHNMNEESEGSKIPPNAGPNVKK